MRALVDWERAARCAMRQDVAPELDLMRRLGNPHDRMRVVHVTGTKGKGSVCALIEAGLLHAGYEAGRYGSPHVEHVTERISLGGRPIGEAAMARALAKALDARDAACVEGTPASGASWFDVMTAAALWSLAEAGMEWAVVEVGLGGRLDSTNVVTPELAIITNVGLEHTDVLGDTVEKIAAEKAGIVKPGRPVLTGMAAHDVAANVVGRTARRLGSDCSHAALPGAGIRARNLALARAALTRLGQDGTCSRRRKAPLGEDDLPDALADAVSLPGRLEVTDVQGRSLAPHAPASTIPVAVDGAHVGFALSGAIEEFRRDARLSHAPVVLLALGRDKHPRDFIGRLHGVAAAVVCVGLFDAQRSWPAHELAAMCRDLGMASEPANSVAEGLCRCLERVDPSSWVLATGSLYLAGAVRSALAAATRAGAATA